MKVRDIGLQIGHERKERSQHVSVVLRSDIRRSSFMSGAHGQIGLKDAGDRRSWHSQSWEWQEEAQGDKKGQQEWTREDTVWQFEDSWTEGQRGSLAHSLSGPPWSTGGENN